MKASRRYLAGVIATVATACLTAGLTQSGASAAYRLPPPHAVEIRLPPNAGLGLAELTTVSCPAAGGCTAAGQYADSSGHYQALVVSQAGGGWARAAELPLPANAALDPHGIVASLTCRAGRYCVGGGSYRPATGGLIPVTVSDLLGSWTTTALRPPPDARTPADADLLGMACATSVSCTGVGSYVDQSPAIQGMAATMSFGPWARPGKVAAPPDAGTNPGVTLDSVACTRLGRCITVGSYRNNSGFILAVSGTGRFGHWGQLHGTVLPPNAAANAQALLTSVTCTSSGWCAAVGQYWDTAGREEAMTVTGAFGHWSAATEIAPPLNAAPNPLAVLDGVACASPGLCLAVGSYASGQNRVAMSTRAIGGHWLPAGAMPPPANAISGPGSFAELLSVACPRISLCVMAGSYADAPGDRQGMVVTVPLL